MIEHLGINTPYFGILVSLIPFVIATYFYKKTNGFFLLAPLFVSMVAGIAFLKLTGISYENQLQYALRFLYIASAKY